MRDEEYVYYQDLREKKTTGYSARKQRTHCGKGGRVKFPSDYLTKKEIKNMSGECKSYRLNEPMMFEEFKSMPDDLQETYLKAIREKYNASDTQIAKMMYTSQASLRNYLARKGLNRTGKWSGKEAWDKEGFYAWAFGIPKQEEQTLEETQGEDVLPFDFTPIEPEKEVIEEETPVIEECSYKQIPNPGIKVNLINAEEELKEEETRFKKCIPTTGSMTYEGKTFDILSSLADLLGNANVVLSVKWDVVED